MKIPGVVFSALAIIGALVLVRECGYRAGAHHAQAAQHDAKADSTIRALRDSLLFVSLDWNRNMEKYQAKLDSARRAVRPAKTIVLTDTVLVAQQFAVRDTLQARTDSLLALTEDQRRFWEAQTRTAYDSIIPSLQRARDNWRASAEKPQYTVTDIGGGALAGYGIAQKCTACGAAGAAMILLPRVWEAVKHIL